MDNDDVQVGRLLTRREALALVGLSGAALLSGHTLAEGARPRAAGGVGTVAGLPACVVRPEQTEGPYFVDEMLNRSDIRADPSTGEVSDGVPLRLSLHVSRVGSGGCAPLPGAQVDLWQCDAAGVYSDVRDRGFTTVGQKFLRGYQVTDADGVVRFTTIYPGWYRGRAVHIHFKIRTDPGADTGREFVSQLYFDDALTDRVHARAPYASRGPRDRRNASDGIFRRGGDQLMLATTESGDGYAARFDIGLQL